MLKAGEPNTPRVLSDGDDRATARSARPCHLRPSPSLPHQATVCRKCFASTRGKLFASDQSQRTPLRHSWPANAILWMNSTWRRSAMSASVQLCLCASGRACNSLVRPPQRDAIGWGPMLPFLSNTSRGTRKERRLVSILPGPPPLKRRDT